VLTPEEIEAAIESGDPKLLKLVKTYLEHPLYTFQPRPDDYLRLEQQTAFVNDTTFKGVICVVGGSGSGKSACAAYKVVRFLMETPPPRPMTPFWVVSQSMKTVCEVCWLKHIKTFLPEACIKDIAWYQQKQQFPLAVILKPHANGNNYVLNFMSYDMSLSRFMGASISGFWADENCPWSIMNELIARCREYDYGGNKLYTVTPITPSIELEKVFNEEEKFADSWKFYRMNTAEAEKAGHVQEGFCDRLMASEVEELKLTRLTGAFASYSGAIFKNFLPAIHVREPFPIPRGWYHIRGLDLGFSCPCACVYVARDQNRPCNYYVYKEYVVSGKDLHEHAASINEGWNYNSPDYGPCYADYEDQMVLKEFARLGLPTINANKSAGSVKLSIARIQQLLRDGRLIIFSNCETLIRQMRTWSWNRYKIDEPQKSDRDVVDSLRYALYTDHTMSGIDKPVSNRVITQMQPKSFVRR